MDNLPQQPALASDSLSDEAVGSLVDESIPPEERPTSFWKTALKVGFAALLIGLMVNKGALNFTVLRDLASPMLVFACFAIVFAQIFVNNYRWLQLMHAQGFDTSIRETLPLSLIGMFFNFAMPGGVGGDVVKGYYLIKDHPEKKYASVVSIFMDRMMGFFVMIATAFVALFLNWDVVSKSLKLQSVATGVTLLFIAFFVFFFLSFSRFLQNRASLMNLLERMPLGKKFRGIYDVMHEYRKHPRVLALTILLSMVNQILAVAIVYIVAIAMGITNIPLAAYFFLVPVGTVVMALPISPAGIGVGQLAFYFLFNLYLGEKSQLGPTAVTTQQLVNFGWGLVGAVFYLRRKK